MLRKLIPTFIANNIFEIDFDKLTNYKTLFIDLDNTLDSPYVYTPNEKIIDLINKLKQNFDVYIISNNKEHRVKEYTKNLNIKYFYDVKKPRVKKIKKIIEVNNIDLNMTLSIGDQIMTDVLMANKLKIDVVLLKPLTIKDEPITFIPRLLDKFFRKKIYKRNLSKEL